MTKQSGTVLINGSWLVAPRVLTHLKTSCSVWVTWCKYAKYERFELGPSVPQFASQHLLVEISRDSYRSHGDLVAAVARLERVPLGNWRPLGLQHAPPVLRLLGSGSVVANDNSAYKAISGLGVMVHDGDHNAGHLHLQKQCEHYGILNNKWTLERIL